MSELLTTHAADLPHVLPNIYICIVYTFISDLFGILSSEVEENKLPSNRVPLKFL